MKLFVIFGAVLAGLGVVSGAFGAHALESVLTEDQISTFQVGVRYQMFHALALVALGLIEAHVPGTFLDISGWCFIIGTCLFSGSIYVLVLSGVKWLGIITPVGGVLLIGGWFLLALHMVIAS